MVVRFAGALQRLRTLRRSDWARRIALALVVVGVAIWLLRSGVAVRLWQDAVSLFVLYAVAVWLMSGGVIATLLLWLVPKWQVRRLPISKDRRFELEIEARKTVAQVIGGAAFLAGLYFTAQTLRVGQETLRVNQEGQITERFTKAIEQLGSKELQIRLGGIYALERIARDSERDHWPIMEVLTTFVRENAPLRKGPNHEAKRPAHPTTGDETKPAADIQAILTVLGRRTLTFRKEETKHLDLRNADLRGASLYRANLQGAVLIGTNLQGAVLFEADLNRANLRGADLRKAQFLTQAQIDSAFTDGTTKCPDELKCQR